MNSAGRMMLAAFGFLACVSSVHSGLISFFPEPSWDTMRVTWGVNLLSKHVFAKVPQTEVGAQKEGYTRVDGDCSGGKFVGNRYLKEGDVAAVLIYDVNGYIAGIQMGIPKKFVNNVTFSSFSYDKTPTYQLDKVAGDDVYFQTTYFIEPSKICNGGRTEKEYKDQGTGTDLYLQSGPDPLNSIKVPRYEKDAVGTQWVKGGCFKTMGVHYWLNVKEDMSCTDFIPFTPIYNRGKLTTFAFVNFGKYSFSKRFEYPPSAAFKLFMPNPVPKCIYDEYDSTGGASTMHVYFNVQPWNIAC